MKSPYNVGKAKKRGYLLQTLPPCLGETLGPNHHLHKRLEICNCG
ncbi:rCG27789 [Rattus norvegicus]|uniref:RCG27789 n=1 Tax=Rattus norvegicus TaxID=10116 RepID=A6KBE3_RAT|nr:rCG27789 [Rattus norvegicus]